MGKKVTMGLFISMNTLSRKINMNYILIPGALVPGDNPAGHAGQPAGHCQCIEDQEPKKTEGLLLCSVSSNGRLVPANLPLPHLIFFKDLAVSAGAMVFNAIQVILQGHWVFSMLVCDVYNAMDVVFSTASILNLFCISMYR